MGKNLKNPNQTKIRPASIFFLPVVSGFRSMGGRKRYIYFVIKTA